MIWQDIAITIINVIFTVSLIPQVYLGFKEKRGTISLLTSTPGFIGLYTLVYIFFTLDLYLTAVITIIVGTLWFLLFLQRLIYKKH